MAQEATLKARVRGQAGPRRQPRAAQAAARADGTDAAADAAAAAQQERDARPDRRRLADRAGHRHQQRAVPARPGDGAGVLRREADHPAHGGHLPPVRRLRQRRGLAAARGDHDHAQHLADAARRQARTCWSCRDTIKTYRYLDDEEIAAAAPRRQPEEASDAHSASCSRCKTGFACRRRLRLRSAGLHQRHQGRRSLGRRSEGAARAAAGSAAGDEAVRDLRIFPRRPARSVRRAGARPRLGQRPAPRPESPQGSAGGVSRSTA